MKNKNDQANKFITISKNREEEIGMIKNDDTNFSNTKKYIGVLVKVAIEDKCSDLSKIKQKQLYEDIMADVPVAVERFVENERDKKVDYKFSTYFTWYIAQHINKA